MITKDIELQVGKLIKHTSEYAGCTTYIKEQGTTKYIICNGKVFRISETGEKYTLISCIKCRTTYTLHWYSYNQVKYITRIEI